MSYTFNGIEAEVAYRRSQLLADAKHSRKSVRLGRRAPGNTSTREQVRDGTPAHSYDLAA
jgi:hypothetical protein